MWRELEKGVNWERASDALDKGLYLRHATWVHTNAKGDVLPIALKTTMVRPPLSGEGHTPPPKIAALRLFISPTEPVPGMSRPYLPSSGELDSTQWIVCDWWP